MAETNIFRSQTESEKNLSEGGFKDIFLADWKRDDIRQNALAKIAKIEYEFTYKKREPFCSKCAINAVEKKIDEINELVKKGRLNKEKIVKADVSMNYEQFGGEKRFERVDDTEIQEDMLISGLKQRVATGIYKNFMCKTCGSQNSMEFRNKEIETDKLRVTEKDLRVIK